MEWSDLRIFLAICRGGTLGGAAKLTGLTQPTMGRRLRTLETMLGQTLFQRTAQGFLLTDEGVTVRLHAERMEAEAISLERELAGKEGFMEGALRISSSDWFGVHMLTPVLAEFAKLQPRVEVELLTDPRLYSLGRQETDLAFRIKRFEEPDVVSRWLMNIPYGLYASAPMETLPVEGNGLSLVVMNTAFGGMPDVEWVSQKLPKARIAARSNNREVQARLCAAGVGLAILPKPLAAHFDGLNEIKLAEQPPGRDTWVGYHRDMRRVRRLRAFMELVLARFVGVSTN
jgi:DNA-binding transcriptional LysR family regulator